MRVGPAAKSERGTGFPRAAAGPPLHRQRSQIRLCRSAPLPRDFGPGRSAAASTLGRCCAARWASPSAPAGRWLREDCGNDPHRRSLMASVGTTGAARDKTDQDLTYPQGGVGSRVVSLIRGRRQAVSCARLCSTYGGGGKGSSDPASGNGELLGPHAPSALLELSTLDPGLGARAQGDGRAASIARGPCRTCTEERSGCITRQCWSSRLSRPDVCEGIPMSCYVCYVCVLTPGLAWLG